MRAVLTTVLVLLSATLVAAQDKEKKVPMELKVVFKTDKGEIRAELYPEEAPLTVMNFVNLAQRGYYDGLMFHRVLADFMIQGGDPTGTGRGGPGYKFEDECTEKRKHNTPGMLSMANAGPGTNGSQFFITHVPTPHLDGKHTVFGKVLEGQKTVDSISQGDKMLTVTIEGDASELFKQHKDRLDEWNKILDKNHPRKNTKKDEGGGK